MSAQALTSATGNFDIPAEVIGGAQYNIRVKQAQDGPASFGGIIYTDKGAPLPGVKVSIARTALLATTDASGKFEMDNVPPGRIDLFVDGRTVNPQNDPARPQWPSLHFEAYVVRGQRNELPHAIYLPALLASEAKTVGGNEDVILTIAGLEGFQMKVKANSVTFPDGSRVGTLVVSPVTADKLPMAPPAGGAQFGVPAWTIQPSGTRFDPPIEVQMPNSTGEIPGDNLPVVQWDHDLGQYVPMGRATVTSDGAFLITDPGSGVTKAGWGGLCRYDGCKTALTRCPSCQAIQMRGVPPCPTCEADPAQANKQCDGDACKRCEGGSCVDKFSKAAPASRSAFNFIGPKSIGTNACPGGWGCFTGVEGEVGVQVELDVAPFCTAEGNWKFKLSKADYTTAIWADATINGWQVMTPSAITALTTCAQLQNLLANATAAASTHFTSPPPTTGFPAMYHFQAIWAHEMVHFEQFRTEFAPAFSEFRSAVESVQIFIESQPNTELAKAAAKAHSSFQDAKNSLQARAIVAKNRTAPHPEPERFRDASLNFLAPMLEIARQRIAAGACLR